jgi:hypothetical protein
VACGALDAGNYSKRLPLRGGQLKKTRATRLGRGPL